MTRLSDAWTQFWFSPSSTDRLVPVRAGLCCVAALWFVSFWRDVGIWFGDTGLLPTSLAAKLIAFEEFASWETWSPLWWSDGPAMAYAWLVSGVGLAIIAGLGFGGRWIVGLLVVWMIAWAHRIVWLTGVVEPAIIALTAYLIVEPGPSLKNFFGKDRAKQSSSWQATVSTRLIQTHCWILLAATLLSQVAGIAWWRGEAIWWLASADRSFLLSVEGLRDRPIWVNSLTHGFIIIEMLALWLLIPRGGRPLGLIFGWLACLSIALVADYWLYGLLLGCALLAFLDWPKQITGQAKMDST